MIKNELFYTFYLQHFAKVERRAYSFSSLISAQWLKGSFLMFKDELVVGLQITV